MLRVDTDVKVSSAKILIFAGKVTNFITYNYMLNLDKQLDTTQRFCALIVIEKSTEKSELVYSAPADGIHCVSGSEMQ